MCSDELVPRAPNPSEFKSLHALLDKVFRSGGGSMAHDYPRLLSEPNRGDLRAVVDAGRVVCHAGVLIRDASIEGIPVRVALLGSVATDPEYRAKGLASKCLRSVMERAINRGADLMWISGGRGLYKRLGAREVGEDLEFSLGEEALSLFARDLDVRPLGEEHIPEMAELYAHEAVRYIRPLEDWRSCLKTHLAMDKPSRTFGAWDSGRLAAYAVVHEADQDGQSSVVEYAGARGVLLCSFLRFMKEMEASSLKLHLAHHDRTLRHRLAAAGLEGKPVAAAGTCLVLSFQTLMEKLRNRFIERAGEGAGSELSFAEEGPLLGADNNFSIACGPDVVTVKGRGPLAEFLFCVPGCSSRASCDTNDSVPCVHGWGAGGPFRASLPVPSLWYGLNFV